MPAIDKNEVEGLTGHWHQSLELPNGYQHFCWMQDDGQPNEHGVSLNAPQALHDALQADGNATLHLYTQHEIFYEEGVLKHTRSSPNWEGGMVTYATCKHLMRTYQKPTWIGTWLAGLCPASCEQNCLLFVGRVAVQTPGNYMLREHVMRTCPAAYEVKRASGNPRGDLYTPRRRLLTEQMHNHVHYFEPPQHTRSVETYSKSPGSVSERADGRVPKWWRDLEYVQRGTRPPCFVLNPCFVFSRPMLWSHYNPRRAVLKLTAARMAAGLLERHASILGALAPLTNA
jgi:hypothetical protein